jgi:hypothetical protein
MVYLQLFHGRKTPDEQMSGWGTEGPVLGTAMALLRLLAETACHGLWALRCADDQQVDAMRRGIKPPGTFRERVEAVGSAP